MSSADTGKTGAYESSHEYVFDEIKLLSLRLLKKSQQYHLEASDGANVNQGLYVSYEEVHYILQNFLNRDPSQKENLEEVKGIEDYIQQMQEYIQTRLAKTPHAVENLTLLKIQNRFGLNDFEMNLILMSFACELDRKFEKIYAFLNDDLNKKAPSIQIALDILCDNSLDSLQNWHYFSPEAKLIRYQIIHLSQEQEANSFTKRSFQIDERIQRFLVGEQAVDRTIKEVVEMIPPESTSQTKVGGLVQKKVEGIFQSNSLDHHVIWLHGSSEEEKRNIATHIASTMKRPLCLVYAEELSKQAPTHKTIRKLLREVMLQSAFLMIQDGDLLTNNEISGLFKRHLFKILQDFPTVSFISARELWAPENIENKIKWHPEHIVSPDYRQRKQIWLQEFNYIQEIELEALASKFHFTEQQIRNVAHYARQFSSSDQPSLDFIYQACSLQPTPRMNRFARKVPPHYKWNDIILPGDTKNHLQEICNCIKHKYLVYSEWGFADKMSLGKGMNILFSGPPGTGKTMAADIIASLLKMKMFKIDISAMTSKYIGETEKNLAEVFDQASAGNAILFFDEADAIFGKRGSVEDAKDRYANIGVNYLLQRIEEHEGVIILATNLIKNIDDAFLRRLHFTVEFPFLDAEHRQVIWKQIFPQNIPLSKDIDYEFLAEKLKFSGGHIKNMALMSAFYAAEDNTKISMDHIIQAAKREYEKMGRTFIPDDFDPYV